MEIQILIMTELLITLFKIDLIVWKSVTAVTTDTHTHKFKIDLIVWKL